ncbi:MAG: putative inorganic carbon transporter subunit DabA, partial [Planctomycetota bacterium]
DTWFVGGQHNTCADTITFFDLDLVPRTHYADFEYVQDTLAHACERNAHERCRRFQSAPLNLSFAAVRRHVEERSEDLAQTRPEFGNASNAMCFVGRRARTRGLYLDRRSFLVSYDPVQDDADSSILARILGAVVPVCSGINLQYYFSYVDSPGWACGTKLPHNVTSLLGVMDGAASDLRPGLPAQGVEIHEPVRLLFVIESTPERIESIMARNETVGRILRNGWVQLALLQPETNEILRYRQGKYESYVPENEELPRVATSTDWYRGWRDHLGFARIGPEKGE